MWTRWAAALAGLVPLAAAPAVAEGIAQARLAEGMQRCAVASPDQGHRCIGVREVDLDLDGIHLYDVRGHWRGRSMTATRVDVRMGDDGLFIESHGTKGTWSINDTTPDQTPAPAAKAASTATATPSSSGASTWTSKIRGWIEPELEHMPVEVNVAGEFDISVGSYDLRLTDPVLHRDANGEVTGRLDLTVGRGDTVLGTARDLEIVGPRRQAVGTGGPQLAVEGVLALAEGDEVGMRAHVERDRLAVQLATRTGGQAWIDIPGWTTPTRAAMRFDALDLGALDPIRGHLDPRIAVDLQHTRISGGLDVAKSTLTASGDDGATTNGLALSFDEFDIEGLVVESAQLSREPLYLDDLHLDGDLELGRTKTVRTDLRIRHGKAKVSIAGHVDGSAVEIDARLARMTCGDLLGSMPRGLVPMLEGTRLAGDIDGHLDLAFRWADVDEAEETERTTGIPQAAPGRLDFDFPFLEACQVERDAPGVDIAALAGPYRHRFLSDGGREVTRVFDPVDPAWVRLEEVPTLARAFVTLEDVGFWQHDGFDREQIVRAFWHDLSASRFSRGASTISQQTARNLWLGIDRSIGRKLQEAVYTSRMEAELDKRRILEIYLNIIELGPEVHGVRDAAQFHFGRPPDELNLLESIHLASLAPGPVMYSRRFENGQVDEAWMEHLHEQVRRMRIHGLITAQAAAIAVRQPLRLRDRSKSN